MSEREHYKGFVHRSCEFWPCHDVEEGEWISCLFCYCPLYLIDCEGDYAVLPNGMKDCSQCSVPHREGGWEVVTTGISAQLFAMKGTGGNGKRI